jgi:hypothetical protein
MDFDQAMKAQEFAEIFRRLRSERIGSRSDHLCEDCGSPAAAIMVHATLADGSGLYGDTIHQGAERIAEAVASNPVTEVDVTLLCTPCTERRFEEIRATRCDCPECRRLNLRNGRLRRKD